LSCPKEPDPPPPPPEPQTLDQRLVGGRWYFWDINALSKPKIANGYYEFKNEFTLIHCNKSNQITEHSVYTKNNIVYWKNNDQELFKYQFYDKFPYRDSSTTGISGSNLTSLDGVAAKNNLITCTIYYDSFELTDTSLASHWRIIRRFKEDLTPY
jgi:hypothetical protein